MTDTTPAALERIMERLNSNDQLPFCPYDRRSPEYWTTPDDKPCVVCGTENKLNAPDFCNGTGSRIMAEAAAVIAALEAELGLTQRALDTMNAASVAHDADLDKARSRATQAEAKLREIAVETSQAFDTSIYVGIKKQMELRIAKVHCIARTVGEKTP